MNNTLYVLSYQNLFIGLFPLFLVLSYLVFRWRLNLYDYIIAISRMFVQLTFIGYFLIYLFKIENPLYLSLILLFMLVLASSISLTPIRKKIKLKVYLLALGSLFLGCSFCLGFILLFIIQPHPWFQPNYLIPLAGMIIASSMNILSLSADRIISELSHQTPYVKAKIIAFKAGLIPTTNSFLAVGLVSIPGLMTGQILSGGDPLLAAKYQILIMSTIFSSGAISALIFLEWLPQFHPTESISIPTTNFE